MALGRTVMETKEGENFPERKAFRIIKYFQRPREFPNRLKKEKNGGFEE